MIHIQAPVRDGTSEVSNTRMLCTAAVPGICTQTRDPQAGGAGLGGGERSRLLGSVSMREKQARSRCDKHPRLKPRQASIVRARER